MEEDRTTLTEAEIVELDEAEEESIAEEALEDEAAPEAGKEEATEEATEEAVEEELEPEDRARRLFASYLEPSEPEVAEAGYDEDEVDLSDLLDEGELVTLQDQKVDVRPAKRQPSRGDEDEEEEGVRPEGRNWYVIHSYSGYENKVKKNLEHRIESLGVQDKIFEVVVPTEEEIELKEGQRRTVERRIFPGYILVDMLMDEDSWYVVRNTPGVTGFVGSVRRPTPLRERDVQRILKRMRAEVPRIKVTFHPGQKVRIADGPFEDFVGTVDEIYPDKGKVRILVSFFGRETPVELDFLQVEKI
jgi:transcription termination/antitermination protein NusG